MVSRTTESDCMRIELSTTYKHFLPAEDAVLEIFGIGFDNMQLETAHKNPKTQGT